jgi:hypothetical protein
MSVWEDEPTLETTRIADSTGVNIASVSAANALKVDGSAVTQPISAASLPLPTGAATAALQTTGNNSLAAIDAGIPAALGQTTMAASMPVVIASNQSAIPVVGNVASGTTDSGNGVKVSGIFNTTVPAFTNGQRGDIQIDERGVQIFARVDGVRDTFSSGLQWTAANAATDIVTITGSATKVIRVTKIIISGTQTTGGLETIYFYRRSSANTGGTLSGGVTLVPFDTQNNTATATVRVYTANPTALGTSVGAFDIFKMFIPTPTLTTDYQPRIVQFGDTIGQAFVLRGTSELLAINLNGVTIAGNVLDINIQWTEE